MQNERQQNRRPYWIEVDPTNLYGWRLDRESNYGNLIQARIAEKAVLPDGQFGEKVFDLDKSNRTWAGIECFVKKSKSKKCMMSLITV